MLYATIGPATDDVHLHTVENLVGLRAGLEGGCHLTPKLTLLGSLAASLLDGNGQANEVVASNEAFFTSATNASSLNTISPALDLSAKLSYEPAPNLKVWLAYDFSEFLNLITTAELAQNYTQSPQPDHSLGFTGPRAGLSWRF